MYGDAQILLNKDPQPQAEEVVTLTAPADVALWLSDPVRIMERTAMKATPWREALVAVEDAASLSRENVRENRTAIINPCPVTETTLDLHQLIDDVYQNKPINPTPLQRILIRRALLCGLEGSVAAAPSWVSHNAKVHASHKKRKRNQEVEPTPRKEKKTAAKQGTDEAKQGVDEQETNEQEKRKPGMKSKTGTSKQRMESKGIAMPMKPRSIIRKIPKD
eukprot:TRINITY_DN15437_c0_g4_i1.p1 TRINITY_DN15437_c0_g4~~TRINITY_DN15437_c0_g4_i1.p1  ORF type:complete len:220 (+),score=43.57 TRINITY_DN15437_c0_g4_i1:722-1381(+)